MWQWKQGCSRSRVVAGAGLWQEQGCIRSKHVDTGVPGPGARRGRQGCSFEVLDGPVLSPTSRSVSCSIHSLTDYACGSKVVSQALYTRGEGTSLHVQKKEQSVGTQAAAASIHKRAELCIMSAQACCNCSSRSASAQHCTYHTCENNGS
jgi:hypothetical protein